MKNEKGYLVLVLGITEKTTEKLARKEIKNYLRRVRSYRQTRSMKLTLQYIYGVNAKSGTGIIIMSMIDGMDAVTLWENGIAIYQTINTNVDKPEYTAMFMRKSCPVEKWTSSRNLKSRYLKHVMKYLTEAVAG